MKCKNRKKILLFSLLLLISLGYAVLNSNLRINGSSKIASSTWNIHFNNIVPKQGSVAIKTGDQAATITPNKDTEVTYSVTLSKPGDFYEFDVDVVNSGSIDGMVELVSSIFKEEGEEDIIINENYSNIPSYLNYSITYSDGAPIKPTYLLKAGETDTYTVRIEFKKDISNNELPEEDQTFNIVVDGDYKQADDTAKERPPYYSCTYNGDLVQGAEYVNGQYTYRYMQEYGDDGWINMASDGWGVTLTDKDSTSPVTSNLCTAINKKSVVSMQQMFSASKATSIDTSSFNTSRVSNMNKMFKNNEAISDLDLSNFDISNVTSMEAMLQGCTNLENLDLSNLDFSNLVYSPFMMTLSGGGFSKLKYLDMSNVIFPANMYYGLGGLSTVERFNFYNADTSKITDMSSMFSGCSSLEELDLSSFDTSNVVNISSMFNNCSSLTELDLSDFDTSRMTNMGAVFVGCNNLEYLDLSNFDFSRVSYSVYNGLLKQILPTDLAKLETLNLSKTKYPNDLSNAFQIRHDLKEIIFDDVDTSNVVNMSNMFNGSTALTNLDLSDFDTSNVTNMEGMFQSLTLTSLDLSDFDTSNVTNMSGMFRLMRNLTDLNVSSFNTSSVSKMDYMFMETNSLSSLDLHSFTIGNADTTAMFVGTGATVGYAKTLEDANKLNSSAGKPSTLNFVVR